MLEDLDLPPVTLEPVCKPLVPFKKDRLEAVTTVHSASELQLLFKDNDRLLLQCVHYTGASWVVDVTEAEQHIKTPGTILGLYGNIYFLLDKENNVWRVELNSNSKKLFNIGPFIRDAKLSPDCEMVWVLHNVEAMNSPLNGLTGWNMQGEKLFQFDALPNGDFMGWILNVASSDEIWYEGDYSGKLILIKNLKVIDEWKINRLGRAGASTYWIQNTYILFYTQALKGFERIGLDDKWQLRKLGRNNETDLIGCPVILDQEGEALIPGYQSASGPFGWVVKESGIYFFNLYELLKQYPSEVFSEKRRRKIRRQMQAYWKNWSE